MFHRTRHNKIPVPIERHTGGVRMPVTGHIRHSIDNAAGNEAKLNGTPRVAARVHTLYLIEPDDVGVCQLVQNAVHHGRFVACRDQRTLAGPVRSDLVKLYNTSRDHRDALGDRGGRAPRIRQSPRQHVGAVREVFHRSWSDSTTLNATTTRTRKPVNVTRCCRTSSDPSASATTPTTAGGSWRHRQPATTSTTPAISKDAAGNYLAACRACRAATEGLGPAEVGKSISITVLRTSPCRDGGARACCTAQ